MRADRLISILILLQTKGRMTARQMAEELEVSERTIYRDIDALCISGIPIYTECGPGGGYELLASYRADLMGLNEQEIRALLMLSIPEPLKQLGVANELKGALIKLSAAIPDSDGSQGWHESPRIHLDSTPWSASNEHIPYLKILHQAVKENKLIDLLYRGVFDTQIHTIAAPYGMVAKTSTWFIVFECNQRMRVIRAADIIHITLLEDRFDYRRDFSLPSFWDQWCKTMQNLRPSYVVTLRVLPGLLELIRYQNKEAEIEQLPGENPGDPEGWVRIKIGFDSFEDARRNILSFGRAAEVLEPFQLRMSVIDFACQIRDFYAVRD